MPTKDPHVAMRKAIVASRRVSEAVGKRNIAAAAVAIGNVADFSDLAYAVGGLEYLNNLPVCEREKIRAQGEVFLAMQTEVDPHQPWVLAEVPSGAVDALRALLAAARLQHVKHVGGWTTFAGRAEPARVREAIEAAGGVVTVSARLVRDSAPDREPERLAEEICSSAEPVLVGEATTNSECNSEPAAASSAADRTSAPTVVWPAWEDIAATAAPILPPQAVFESFRKAVTPSRAWLPAAPDNSHVPASLRRSAVRVNTAALLASVAVLACPLPMTQEVNSPAGRGNAQS